MVVPGGVFEFCDLFRDVLVDALDLELSVIDGLSYQLSPVEKEGPKRRPLQRNFASVVVLGGRHSWRHRACEDSRSDPSSALD